MILKIRIPHRLTGFLFILLVTSLSACNLPAQESGLNFSAEIFNPVDGTHVSLGTELEIQSLISSPGTLRGVSLQVNGQTIREDLFTKQTLQRGTIYQPWTPQTTGMHTLQIFLIGTEEQVSSNVVTIYVDEQIVIPSEIIAVEEVTATVITETTTMTATVETETPTITLTVTADIARATANQNTNCRKGPGTAYSIAWVFMDGQTAPIMGQNQQSTWLVIERLDGFGECWVQKDLVTTSGDTGNLPVIPAPPLPATPTPTLTLRPVTDTPVPPSGPVYNSCKDYPDLSTCLNDPNKFGNCSWNTGQNRCEP